MARFVTATCKTSPKKSTETLSMARYLSDLPKMVTNSLSALFSFSENDSMPVIEWFSLLPSVSDCPFIDAALIIRNENSEKRVRGMVMLRLDQVEPKILFVQEIPSELPFLDVPVNHPRDILPVFYSPPLAHYGCAQVFRFHSYQFNSLLSSCLPFSFVFTLVYRTSRSPGGVSNFQSFVFSPAATSVISHDITNVTSQPYFVMLKNHLIGLIVPGQSISLIDPCVCRPVFDLNHVSCPFTTESCSDDSKFHLDAIKFDCSDDLDLFSTAPIVLQGFIDPSLVIYVEQFTLSSVDFNLEAFLNASCKLSSTKDLAKVIHFICFHSPVVDGSLFNFLKNFISRKPSFLTQW
ncbi:hypothetical protein GEMRC1_007219 [Eukaryota sp. GEM-RC1]